ncbi:MAG: HAD-IA family hydrolase [Thermotogota bacterium]
MLFKNYIWDFDGTVVDTYPATISSIIKTMKKYDIHLDYKTIYKKAKITLSEVFDYIIENYGFDDNIVSEIINDFSKLAPSEREPYVDIKKVLNKINNQNGYNFLVTHRDRDSTLEILNYFDLKKYFKEIITSDDGFNLKPDPDSFVYLINKYYLKNNFTVGIGDRLLDIGAAKNSNIYSIFMNFDKIEYDYKSDYVFTNYNDFYNKIILG